MRLLKTLQAIDHSKTYRHGDFFEAYPKQAEFFNLGAMKRERLLTAGNQQGKTHAGAYEMSRHLTGEYPSWWKGRRFLEPIKAWAVGETGEKTRDNPQAKLFGEPGVENSLGTGMVPKESIIDRALGRGARYAFDTVQVMHKTFDVKKGSYIQTPTNTGPSIIKFKSYDQGRETFESDSVHVIWDDEECPMPIYYAELARITTTKGMIYTTYTSIKGDTELTDRFLRQESPDRAAVTMGLRDARHIPESEYETIIAGYPEHERVARIYGGIMRGEGRVFAYPEEGIVEPPLEYIPPYWRKIWGIDPGIGHPFAAALLIFDMDNDVVHLHHTIRIQDATPLQHWAAMRLIGANVPVAYPKDAADREKSTGAPLAAVYRGHGAPMLPVHATWADGSMSTEAGITEWDERERTGRFKAAAQLGEFFEERRNYHRKNNLVVKIKDDIMSAVRVGLMMKRFARAVPLGGAPLPRPMGAAAQFAIGTQNHPDGDMDVWA